MFNYAKYETVVGSTPASETTSITAEQISKIVEERVTAIVEEKLTQMVEEKISEIQTSISEDVAESDEVEERISEIVEEKISEIQEIEEAADAVEEETSTVVEIVEDVESVEALIASIKENNGLTKQAYSIVNRNDSLGGMFKCLNITLELPSVESYNEYAFDHDSLITSLEEAKVSMFERIKAFLKRLWDSILTFFKKLAYMFNKDKKEIVVLVDQAKKSTANSVDVEQVVSAEKYKSALQEIFKLVDSFKNMKVVESKTNTASSLSKTLSSLQADDSATWTKAMVVELYSNTIKALDTSMSLDKMYEAAIKKVEQSLAKAEKAGDPLAVKNLQEELAATQTSFQGVRELVGKVRFLIADYKKVCRAFPAPAQKDLPGSSKPKKK